MGYGRRYILVSRENCRFVITNTKKPVPLRNGLFDYGYGKEVIAGGKATRFSKFAFSDISCYN